MRVLKAIFIFTVMVVALGQIVRLITSVASSHLPESSPNAASKTVLQPANTGKKLTSKQQAVQEKQQEKQQAAQDKELRVQYAQIIDNATLDMGIESTTRATGPDRTTLYIKDVLAGRVGARAIERGLLSGQGLIALKALGFKKIVYTNGFESELGETYSWTIK